VSPSGISENDERYIRTAIALAKYRSPAGDTSVFDFIHDVLLTRIADGHDGSYRDAVTRFAMKFQQFSSPVMAKGIEDTAFYGYNRLVSLNEVGSDPRRFGIPPAEFHRANRERLRDWPHTMLATSTHDSKRSEDVRARINVLSEIPALWQVRVQEWAQLNHKHKSAVDGRPAPSLNDEYLLYQTFVGVWPAKDLQEQTQRSAFTERIDSYMLKAIREAKQNTSWINRNEFYEKAVSSFVKALLDPEAGNRFHESFAPFQRRIARLGLWNSLSQTLLKLASPGVPDIYQGNEVWDFSLVDPDNRRAIDYAARREISDRIRASDSSSRFAIGSLLENPDDGYLKMYVVKTILWLRAQQPEIFESGDYLPLEVRGTRADHLVAFIRKKRNAGVLVVVPRLVAGLLGDSDHPPIGRDVWQDTQILLPTCDCSKIYRDAFTGEAIGTSVGEQGTHMAVSDALARFPVSICQIG
ncbi:MAG: hypothetical protein WBX38_00190, partial [Candidatus Sulfotelmatobacter sp.]